MLQKHFCLTNPQPFWCIWLPESTNLKTNEHEVCLNCKIKRLTDFSTYPYGISVMTLKTVGNNIHNTLLLSGFSL